jgi:hypothetical protein
MRGVSCPTLNQGANMGTILKFKITAGTQIAYPKSSTNAEFKGISN